ncbi:hypothetical protein WICPIJ_000851 [Wickerhamomyces pijperi]|uniref:Uncharacterized protein n=1 Tax=Wickerhamomyces pijperi TaxID=599730 RepID=A0A9P8QCY9_WICPI|nr:hypothetical protein WICPIJ_000851 [Wickerhamomyces pijperi]
MVLKSFEHYNDHNGTGCIEHRGEYQTGSGPLFEQTVGVLALLEQPSGPTVTRKKEEQCTNDKPNMC